MSRRFTVALHVRLARLRSWAAEPERGDIPGWVLITIMTAGLVAVLWVLAESMLTEMFQAALESVRG